MSGFLRTKYEKVALGDTKASVGIMVLYTVYIRTVTARMKQGATSTKTSSIDPPVPTGAHKPTKPPSEVKLRQAPVSAVRYY